jgi:hypothetical protein
MTNVIQALLNNWQQAVTGGIIVSCAVIFIMGCLKRFLDKTPLKNYPYARKAVLAFGSLLLTFPMTALYFVADKIPFDYYWYGCALMCVGTIVTYWLYENTALRKAIHAVGAKTVGKYWGIFYEAYVEHKTNKDTSNRLAMTTAELGEVVKKELKKHVKEDNDLKGL